MPSALKRSRPYPPEYDALLEIPPSKRTAAQRKRISQLRSAAKAEHHRERVKAEVEAEVRKAVVANGQNPDVPPAEAEAEAEPRDDVPPDPSAVAGESGNADAAPAPPRASGVGAPDSPPVAEGSADPPRDPVPDGPDDGPSERVWRWLQAAVAADRSFATICEAGGVVVWAPEWLRHGYLMVAIRCLDDWGILERLDNLAESGLSTRTGRTIVTLVGAPVIYGLPSYTMVQKVKTMKPEEFKQWVQEILRRAGVQGQSQPTSGTSPSNGTSEPESSRGTVPDFESGFSSQPSTGGAVLVPLRPS